MAPVQLPEVTHEDARGFWAAAIAGAGAILAWLGRAFMVGAKSEPPEDPREAREKRDATRDAIRRIEETVNTLGREVTSMARESAADHARAAAQREEIMTRLEDTKTWLLELSGRTGALENQVAGIRAVDEDRRDRKRN